MAKKPSKNKNDINWFQALEVHKKRTPRSRKLDESKTAKKSTLEPTKTWMKNQATSDIVGIDSKKYKAKSAKEVGLFLQSTFKKVNNTFLKQSDFNFRDENKAILTIKPRANKKSTLKNLQTLVNLRYNNISIRSRRAKNKSNDFWIVKIGGS